MRINKSRDFPGLSGTCGSPVGSFAAFPWWLTPCKKLWYWFDSFQTYWLLKNPAIWLFESILGHPKEPYFYQTCGFCIVIKRTLLCTLCTDNERHQLKFSHKSKKPILKEFLGFFPRIGIFLKTALSLKNSVHFLSVCRLWSSNFI